MYAYVRVKEGSMVYAFVFLHCKHKNKQGAVH